MTQRVRTLLTVAAAVIAAGGVTGCSTLGGGNDEVRPQSAEQNERGGFLGFGGSAPEEQNQIGVNSFLWQASLDTLNFLPVTSTDPFGGVIVFDWFADPNVPNERFKATVYVLDTRLRADALNVSVFRQQWINGGWVDAPVNPDTEIQLEHAILDRARELRLSTLRD